MTVLAGVKPGAGHGAGEGKPSWPVFLLWLAVVISSFLSALSLYQLVDLRSEIEALKLTACHRREEGQEARYGDQSESDRRSSQEAPRYPGSPHALDLIRRRRTTAGKETSEISSELYTGIPWQTGLKRGSALEEDNDRILVREEGFYFVYSQVYYMDSTFAMGHVVIRWKRTVVGDELSFVILFRCIQTMNPEYAFNTCYTGGIVKLEVGDYLELLIPRPAANVSLDGDSTFLGAVKLA